MAGRCHHVSYYLKAHHGCSLLSFLPILANLNSLCQSTAHSLLPLGLLNSWRSAESSIFAAHPTILLQIASSMNFKMRCVCAGEKDEPFVIHCHPSDFLFSYRSPPHATTNISPSEVFLQRKLHTHFDLLKPSSKKNCESSLDGQHQHPELWSVAL